MLLKSPKRATSLLVAVTITLGIQVSALPSASAEDRTFAEVVTAGGQQQWISCAGSGSPTIVLATGLRADASSWGILPRALQRISRTCVYDRPGLGRSPARLGPTTVTSADHANELNALLTEVGEVEPVVLVGSGYGDSLIRTYAQLFDVTGVVVMDGVFPTMHRTYLPAFRSPWDDTGSRIDMQESEATASGDRIYGNAPLIILTSGKFDAGTPKWARKRWTNQQRQSATQSTNALWISVPESMQRMWQSHPQSVINAVRTVVKAAVDGSDLQCQFNWNASNGACTQVN